MLCYIVNIFPQQNSNIKHRNIDLAKMFQFRLKWKKLEKRINNYEPSRSTVAIGQTWNMAPKLHKLARSSTCMSALILINLLQSQFAGIAIPPGTHRRKPMLQQQNSKTDSPFHQQKYAEKNTSKLSGDHNEEYMLQCISPPTPPLSMVNYRSTKRRKGIPQRAPMGICWQMFIFK